MPYLACTANMYSGITVETRTHGKSVHFTSTYFLYTMYKCTCNTVNHCKQCYFYSTVHGSALKYKQYSGIKLETETCLKSVKITLNIFAVWLLLYGVIRVHTNF